MSPRAGAALQGAQPDTKIQDSGTDTSMASDHDTNITSASSDGEDGGDEDDDGDDDEVDHRLDAKPLFDFISQHAKAAAQEFDSLNQREAQDFSAFKAFMRSKFAAWRTERAATNNGADVFITTPPLNALDIQILDDNEPHQCPCCLGDSGTDIDIRAPDGITEDIFLGAICDYLYGDDVEEEDLPLDDIYKGGLVVGDFNYMIHNEGMLYSSSYERPRIWLYCAAVGKCQGESDE